MCERGKKDWGARVAWDECGGESNFVELGFSYHGGDLGVTLRSSGLLSKLHYSLDHLASLGKYFYMAKDETLSK